VKKRNEKGGRGGGEGGGGKGRGGGGGGGEKIYEFQIQIFRFSDFRFFINIFSEKYVGGISRDK